MNRKEVISQLFEEKGGVALAKKPEECLDYCALVWSGDILPVGIDTEKALAAVRKVLDWVGASGEIVGHDIVVGPLAAYDKAREMGASSPTLYPVGSSFYADILMLHPFCKEANESIQAPLEIIMEVVDAGIFSMVLLQSDPDVKKSVFHPILIPNPVREDGRAGVQMERRGGEYVLHNVTGPAISFKLDGKVEHQWYVLGRPADDDMIRHILWKRGHPKGVKFPVDKFTEISDSDYRGRVLQVVGDEEMIDYLDMELVEKKTIEQPFLDPYEFDLQNPTEKNPRYQKDRFLDHYEMYRTRQPVEAFGEHVVLVKGWDPGKYAPTYMCVPPDTKNLEQALFGLGKLSDFGIAKYAATFVS